MIYGVGVFRLKKTSFFKKMETCGFSYLIQNCRTSFYFRMAYGIRVQHCPNSKGNPKRRTTTKWNLTTGWVRYHSKCNYRMVTPTNQKEKQDFEHNIYQLIGQVSRLYRATNKQKEHRWRSVPAPTAIGHSPQRNAAVIQDSPKSAQHNRTTPLSVLRIHPIIPTESRSIPACPGKGIEEWRGAWDRGRADRGRTCRSRRTWACWRSWLPMTLRSAAAAGV